MNNIGRPKNRIILSDEERKSLEVLSISTLSSKCVQKRAKIILLSSDGKSSTVVSEEMTVSDQTVNKWRQRYLSCGINSLMDKVRSGRKCRSVKIIGNDFQLLSEWSRSRSLPEFLVKRAKIILFAAEGKSNFYIASKVAVCDSTVRKWKQSYRLKGLDGLYDEYRPGRPRTYSEEQVAAMLNKTLETKPEGATHWSCRTMAGETGISASTVSRIWNLFSLRPHKQNHFKISTDPFFVDKVVDVCGLYLNPPDNAMVLCIDEKSQCQALERTQPILPMGLGYAEGVTDNYYRHGVITLFSALDAATGKVYTACKKRHRHQEFIAFLNQIKRNVPSELEIHVILDNYSTHKHEKVKSWIIRNPRFKFHFTPTYSSWLNQVERWFGIITDKAIRRGSFKSTAQLTEKINEFTEVYNRNAKPFLWAATSEEILSKIGRLCNNITGDV